MKLIALEIKPLSAFATTPKGDTIFGQVLSYLFLQGDTTFANYLNEEPQLIISDMMPFGYVYRPTLPVDCFGDNNIVDKKDLRRREFISLENLSLGLLEKCEKIEFVKKISVIKNSISRITFSTDSDEFAPYANNELHFTRNLWMFVYVNESLEDRVIDTIKQIGKYGFGKEANSGKGMFDVTSTNPPDLNLQTNYFMSLSPTILEGQKFEQVWYEPFTRFGKFGAHNAHSNAFKNPAIMANSSAVVKSSKQLQYFGKSVNNGNNKPSFLQGYSIAIPLQIKDDSCLNIE